MILTNDDVQEILRLLDDTSYDELHLKTENFTLSLKRSSAGQGGWTQEIQTLSKADVTQLSKTKESVADETTQATKQTETSTTQDGLEEIRSPMVGTFYRAPKPGDAAFVEIGSKVEENSVVAIIEVMKLMNSIAAGVAGELVEILVEDAQFVEKGQLLMRVKPGPA